MKQDDEDLPPPPPRGSVNSQAGTPPRSNKQKKKPPPKQQDEDLMATKLQAMTPGDAPVPMVASAQPKAPPGYALGSNSAHSSSAANQTSTTSKPGAYAASASTNTSNSRSEREAEKMKAMATGGAAAGVGAVAVSAAHQNHQNREAQKMQAMAAGTSSTTGPARIPSTASSSRRAPEAPDDAAAAVPGAYTIHPTEDVSGIPVAPAVSHDQLNREAIYQMKMQDNTLPETAAPTAIGRAIPEATPEEEAEQKKKKKRKFLLIGLAVLLVAAIAIGAGVGATAGGGSSEDKNVQSSRADGDTSSVPGDESTVSPMPTLSPTISFAPTTFEDRVYALVTAFSGTKVVDDETSPQHQAYEWVRGYPGAEAMSDAELLLRYGLASLYYSTQGSNWKTFDFLLTGSGYCAFAGVGCDENQTLTSLILPEMNLQGTIPKELGLLTDLTKLNLVGNALMGTLPTELGLLNKLETFYLPGNTSEWYQFLTDDISIFPPKTTRQLEDGTVINYSRLTGSFPSEFGLMTALKQLHLYGHALTGSLPTQIGRMSALTALTLGQNQLSGTIPIQLQRMSNLQQLTIDRNDFFDTAIPNLFCSSISNIVNLASDCLTSSVGARDEEVICKCCNICCNNTMCVDVDVTEFPSASPTTSYPSASPSALPSSLPSVSPSASPTPAPSGGPTNAPSALPSRMPSAAPSAAPSSRPTVQPSVSPTRTPTPAPSYAPSYAPTPTCSIHPTSCTSSNACPENAAELEVCVDAESCTARQACADTEQFSVGQNSCTARSACKEFEDGSVGNGSCTEESSCFGASADIGDGSCTEENSCTRFAGNSIGSNSCKCPECCACYGTGELPDVIPSNACNVRGECCSTPSPTVSPTKNPTMRPTTAAPTTPRPTPTPTHQPTARPTQTTRPPTPGPTPAPTRLPTVPPALTPFDQIVQNLGLTASNLSEKQKTAVRCLAQVYGSGTYTWGLNELEQRYALALFFFTIVPDWRCPGGWLTSNSWGCTGHGTGGNVVCNNSNRVTALNYISAGLTGTGVLIPSELSWLPNLNRLLLHDNDFTGTIPDSLGYLSVSADCGQCGPFSSGGCGSCPGEVDCTFCVFCNCNGQQWPPRDGTLLEDWEDYFTRK